MDAAEEREQLCPKENDRSRAGSARRKCSRSGRCSALRRQGMEGDEQVQLHRRFKFLYVVASVLGLVVVLLTGVWLGNYRGGFSWEDVKLEFNYHPLFMVIGMVFLYAQGIMVYRIGRTGRKRHLKIWHACIHISVFILTVIALKAVFDSHNCAKPTPIANLYTLHSWIGMIVVILFSCQYVAGFISYLYPGLPMFIRVNYMNVHTGFGVGVFALAVVTALLGLSEKAIFTLKDQYARLESEAVLVNLLGIFLVLFGSVVLYLVNERDYKRTPIPEDDMLLAERPDRG